jgi:DNA-binding NarL/FixJ family response regulator
MQKKSQQNKKRIRVMLVDDHSGMRAALTTMINAERDLIVVAEADGARSALELLGRAKPDVVLMDGSMPGINGMEATRQLRKLQPSVIVIGLTLYEERTYLEEMITAGAKGYVLKTEAPTTVAKAIRAVAAGGTFFDKLVRRPSSITAENQPITADLSVEELAVLKRLANGRTNSEIAADLGLNLPAVETRRSSAMKKLNLRSRAQLARVAAQRQWLDA